MGSPLDALPRAAVLSALEKNVIPPAAALAGCRLDLGTRIKNPRIKSDELKKWSQDLRQRLLAAREELSPPFSDD